MYQKKKVSLVFPAFNEEKNIAKAIKDFRKIKLFDEIIVVDNNSTDKTARLALAEKAKVVTEKKQGYGFALRKGMGKVTGDIVFLCEPDGTFKALDAFKLIKFIDRYDVVIGTRTNKKYIQKNANMTPFLLWGNKGLAKFIQILYQPGCSLSDCGCTFRAMKKDVVKKVFPRLKVGKSHFLSELLVLTIILNFKITEVPVNYRRRIGESKITGSLKRSVFVGLNMFRTAVSYRFK